MDSHTITAEQISIRRRRADCLARLVSLSEEQQALLTEGRHADLAANLAGFDPLLLELKRAEKREESVERHDCSMPDDGLPQEARDLDNLIAERAERLRLLTETNRRLLGNAMDMVSFSMQVICKAATDPKMGGMEGNGSIVMDIRA